MGAATLPFEIKNSHSHRSGVTDCPMFKLLSAPLQRESETNHHLLDYIHLLPVEQYGLPEYYAELDRKLGDLENPNLIYPVGHGMYIHIYPNPKDARNHYIAIEPGMLSDNQAQMEELENHLVDHVGALEEDSSGDQERRKALLKILKQVCKVVRPKDLRQVHTMGLFVAMIGPQNDNPKIQPRLLPGIRRRSPFTDPIIIPATPIHLVHPSHPGARRFQVFDVAHDDGRRFPSTGMHDEGKLDAGGRHVLCRPDPHRVTG